MNSKGSLRTKNIPIESDVKTEMLTDSHAHLVSLENLQEVLKRAYDEGVRKIVSIASDLESSQNTISLANREEVVFATVGVHPHNASITNPKIIGEFRNLLNNRKVVAIGETGLDYYYMNSEREVQIGSLVRHIKLAREANLPIVLHVREAESDLVAILKRESLSDRGGVIHCFTGGYETARKYLELGFYISFSGIVTFKKSEEIRDAAKKIPKDKILIETDSPYLTPEPFRRRANEPAYVKYIAETIAGVRGTSFEEIADITTANADRLFGLEGISTVAGA